jgi:disulfide bond formation protein DsbB
MSALFCRQSLKLLNAIDLIVISGVMIVAFFLQFYLNELPCPLCLLQRVGLLAIGFGFLLNLRYCPKPSHYALSLVAAVFTACVALRQICLHIIPGTGNYGDALFGLHLYTWVFIACMFAVIYISIILSFPEQYARSLHSEKVEEPKVAWQKTLVHAAFFVFFLLVVANAFSVFYECGVRECPDNPLNYVYHLRV